MGKLTLGGNEKQTALHGAPEPEVVVAATPEHPKSRLIDDQDGGETGKFRATRKSQNRTRCCIGWSVGLGMILIGLIVFLPVWFTLGKGDSDDVQDIMSDKLADVQGQRGLLNDNQDKRGGRPGVRPVGRPGGLGGDKSDDWCESLPTEGPPTESNSEFEGWMGETAEGINNQDDWSEEDMDEAVLENEEFEDLMGEAAEELAEEEELSEDLSEWSEEESNENMDGVWTDDFGESSEEEQEVDYEEQEVDYEEQEVDYEEAADLGEVLEEIFGDMDVESMEEEEIDEGFDDDYSEYVDEETGEEEGDYYADVGPTTDNYEEDFDDYYDNYFYGDSSEQDYTADDDYAEEAEELFEEAEDMSSMEEEAEGYQNYDVYELLDSAETRDMTNGEASLGDALEEGFGNNPIDEYVAEYEDELEEEYDDEMPVDVDEDGDEEPFDEYYSDYFDGDYGEEYDEYDEEPEAEKEDGVDAETKPFGEYYLDGDDEEYDYYDDYSYSSYGDPSQSLDESVNWIDEDTQDSWGDSFVKRRK